MKVLFIDLDWTSLMCFRKELVFSLLADGHDVNVVVRDNGDFSELTNAGAKLIPFNAQMKSKNPFSNLRDIKAYKKIIRGVSPDIILSFTIKPNLYAGIANKERIPQIANVTGLGKPFEKKGLLRRLTCSLYKRAYKNISTVFYQNEEEPKDLERLGIKAKHYVVIPGSGVNTERFSYREYPHNDRFIFVYMSRVMKRKGIDNFLKLAISYHNENKLADFYVVGRHDEDYKKMIDKYADEGVVKYIPFTKTPEEYYIKADAVVLPSYYLEGTNNVLLEASASGRPILTSLDTPGCNNVLIDGVNGFGFHALSFDELKAAADRLFSLPREEREKMGRAARENVLTKFDRRIVIQHYKDEIQRLSSK